MNKVFLSGAIDKEFDLKATSKGSNVVSLLLKCYNDSSKKAFVVMECTFWGDLADQVYGTCEKGDYLEVEGAIVKQQYQDKKGVTQYKTSITVNKFEAVTGNINKVTNATNKYSNHQEENYYKEDDTPTLEYDDNDLPF